MAQRTAFAGSPENAGWGSDVIGGSSGNSNASGRGEKVGTGVMLGPFGTEIGGRGSGSMGRPSVGESATGSGISGDGSMQSSIPQAYGVGNRYSRVDEGDEGTEYMGAGANQHLGGTRSTANSSMEDLLGGQEPSFFSVVLNPRRTLRVVNLD